MNKSRYRIYYTTGLGGRESVDENNAMFGSWSWTVMISGTFGRLANRRIGIGAQRWDGSSLLKLVFGVENREEEDIFPVELCRGLDSEGPLL